MCESNVYIKIDGGEELLARDIVSLTPKEDKFILIDIIGNRYEVENVAIEYIDFVSHKVVLKRK